MKNSIRLMIAIAVIILSQDCSIAQFTISSQGDIAMGTTGVNSRQTGNDFLLNGSDRIEVSVWDAGNGSSEFGYRINGGSQTILSLSSSSGFDPDVCLIKDSNGDVHAIVVYYDVTGSDYLLDVFDLSGTTFTMQTGCPHNIFANVSFGTSINIDSDDSYNFMVIWDEVSSNRLKAIAGDHTNSTINFTNSPIPVGSNSNLGTFPDLCLYGNGSNRVTYTYIYNGDLYVDTDDIPTIAGGSTSASNVLVDNTPTYNGYEWPRIACPPSNQGTMDDWTVVFMDTDGSAWYLISGHTNNGGVLQSNDYNDGSAFCPTPIDNYTNFMPVVSYDNHSPSGIYVGWMHDNTGGSGLSKVATLPIVLQCDDNGATLNNVDYLEVSNSPSTGDFDVGLSLSGRNGNDWLFITLVKDVPGDIYTKSINGISSATSLRMPTNSSVEEHNKLDLSNALQINVYNLMGEAVYSRNLKENDSLLDLDKELNQFLNGIFILNVVFSDGSNTSKKFLYVTQ